MHLCRAPLDRLAMQQQHFLPLLKPCSYPHLLFPQGSFVHPSPGPQALKSGESPSMSPLTQLVSLTLELMPEEAGKLRRSDTGRQPQVPIRAKGSAFFFNIEI